LRASGAEVVGISRDDPETLRRFREELALPFELTSDADGSITKAYGVAWPLVGLARRVTFVIGGDRRVKSVHSSEWAPVSHAAHACDFLAGRG
jgi:thioredoxin-dependent peroxiredoxin